MPDEQRAAPPPAEAPDLDVSPVVVLSRTFQARPASLPEAQAFVSSSLAESPIEQEYLRAVQAAILDAMLLAAGSDSGNFQVVIHLYPDDAQVEVLAPADRARADSFASDVLASDVLSSHGEPFAVWLNTALRRQGMSQEAAARQLGVSVRTVSRWVRGQTEPRLRDMRRIHEVFGRNLPG
ncbi:MAG TPA: helix-turn-helix transcriptional regulator [Jatrophihabitans sp.]|jgi:DNA-binding XRE family transcriptional regulator